MYKAVPHPVQNITAGQNPGLKLVVLQPARERRAGCLQQGTGINAAPEAPQACREVTDSLETLKSLTENNAGYDVGKICRAKAMFPTTEEQNKGESR